MSGRHRIITDNSFVRRNYQNLGSGDCIVGRLRLKPSEEHLLVDLLERGVHCFPSALSQLLSRSKSMQALVFSEYMLPGTRPVHDRHDLLECMNRQHKNAVSRIVTKLDRSNAGMGILLWSSIEDVYAQAVCGGLSFPFVVQPFCEDAADIRVIVLGEYVEAYTRTNPHNFRKNLHTGGESAPCELTTKQWELCKAVMARGKFPYAHIDLLVTRSGESFLTEINLRGGIRGAAIDAVDYRTRLDAIHAAVRKRFEEVS